MAMTDSGSVPTHAGAQPSAERMSYADFFKSRTELVKAYCETARSYIQISSAALALPILFTQVWLGESSTRPGLYATGVPWSLVAAWASFLLAIAFGLAYQWLVVRRLWDQLHSHHFTPEEAREWGIAPGHFVPKFEWLDRAYLYGGMVTFFYLGACFFVLFTWTLLEAN